MPKFTRLAVAPLMVILMACGGKANGTGESDGGSGSVGAGGGNSGGKAPAGGTTSSGGTTNVAGDTCASYDDEAAAYVNVVLINKTDAPIYLGLSSLVCNYTALFQIADVDGKDLPPLNFCRLSCVGARKYGAGGCPAICGLPRTIELKPGELYSTTWDGLFSTPGKLAPTCVPFEANEPLVCDQAKRIETGTFTFSALAGTTIDCSQTSGDKTCAACAPDGNGGCTTQGSLIGGKMLTATTTLLLDESYGLYGSAQPADPSQGSGAGPSGARPLAVVNLLFEN